MYNKYMRIIYVKNLKSKETVQIVNYISKTFPNLKKSTLYKALRNKDIRVNDKKINENIMIKNNDKIDIYIKDNLLFDLPQNINYIYNDENIIIAFKPQNILSNDEEKNTHNNNTQNYEPTFEDLVKKDYNDAKLLNRLDRNTSGLVIFSRNQKSYDALYSAFKNGDITKEYIAYVTGYNFQKKHDILTGYILKDKKTSYSKVLKEKVNGSKQVITEYNVLSINKNKDFAILKIILHTGKTHQIRAHLKSINHPIIGDSKYGINEINKKFNKYKQLLIAYSYTFKFDINSPLYYLNNKRFELDKKIYTNILGCE